MNKNRGFAAIGVVLLVGLVAFIAFGIGKGKGSGDDSRPATTSTTRPAVTTTTNDYALRLKCAEAFTTISDGLDAISDGASLLPYADDATAREFLATAREFVQTSIVTVDLCASLDPVGAARARAGLEELDDSIASLEYLY